MSSSSSFVHPAAQVAAGSLLPPGCHIEAGAVVPAGCVLGERVRIGPNAVIVAHRAESGETPSRLHDDVEIGAGAVIYAGLTLATGVVVRPGAVVNRSVPHRAIVEGNPATIVGYVDAHTHAQPDHHGGGLNAELLLAQLPVAGASLHRMAVVPDLRGSLSVGEFERSIPFKPLRYFMVFDVPSRETRGEHAHRECHQFLICVRGSCTVVVDDGRQRAEVRLDRLDTGLYLPPMVWGIQYQYSSDAVLLVFASHHYDPADYIRDYDEFLRARQSP